MNNNREFLIIHKSQLNYHLLLKLYTNKNLHLQYHRVKLQDLLLHLQDRLKKLRGLIMFPKCLLSVLLSQSEQIIYLSKLGLKKGLKGLNCLPDDHQMCVYHLLFQPDNVLLFLNHPVSNALLVHQGQKDHHLLLDQQDHHRLLSHSLDKNCHQSKLEIDQNCPLHLSP